MRKTLPFVFMVITVLAVCAGQVPLFAGGTDTTGYVAESGESITLTGNNVKPDGLAHALWAKPGGKITMSGGTLGTSASYYHPVYATGGTINLHNVNVYLGHTGYEAVLGTSGSTINMTGGGVLSDKYYAAGVSSSGGSAITLTDVDVETRGWFSFGIYSTGNGSEITMNGGSIKTYDQYSGGVPTLYDSYGAYATGTNALVTLNNVRVSTYGSTGNGAWALAVDQGGHIVMNGGSLYTEGQYSYGLALLVGRIDASNVSIETKANNTHGAYGYYYGSTVNLTGSDIKTFGSGSAGLLAWDGAETTMTDGSIATSNNGAYGAWSRGDSQIYLQNVKITTEGEQADAILAQNGGYVSIDSVVILVEAPNAYAIRAYGSASDISVVRSNQSTYSISGDIAAQNYSLVDLELGNGSTLTGRTSVSTANSTLHLDMDGSGSVWNVTGNSTLTDMLLSGSTVNFRTAGLRTVVNVANLNPSAGADGGYLTMKTDIVNETADLLRVTGTTDGSHGIRVANVGSSRTTGDEITLLVETADNGGNFSLVNGGVSLGAWYYELRQNLSDYGAGAGWELYATGSSPGGEGAVNTFIANYLMGYVETQTLIQRLGDLREVPELSGLWFRAHGGKIESNAKSYVRPFDFEYGGVQLGYDRKVDISWEGDSYLGIMFGYSTGDLDYMSRGTGTVDSKTAALYWTSIKPNGFYIDAVIKYVWMENDFSINEFSSDGTSSIMERGNGVSTGGFGASLEFGERWHFEREKRSGWYLEPQVQLSYQRQNGGSFLTSNGLDIGVEPFNSLIGRLGILVGCDDEKSNFYMKVSKEREFLGDLTIIANGIGIKEKMNGSWWTYGLGYTSKINERNTIYLDLERSSGGGFTKQWAAKAGWRLLF